MINPASYSSSSLQRDTNKMSGRLVALATSTQQSQMNNQLNNARTGAQSVDDSGVAIDFPCMPHVIELARSADYAVSPNMILPDGVHQYRSTKPLEIPISFRLHAFDQEYCHQGAKTLLQLAATLHSFILPINKDGAYNSALITPATNPSPQTGGGQPSVVAMENNGSAVTPANNGQFYNVTIAAGISPPVSCWLHLIYINESSPGISCLGYVKDVSVKLNESWMRGQNGSFNLPTSADFSFTFVHRPGQSNNSSITDSAVYSISTSDSVAAYADDVAALLYNTRNLIQYGGNFQNIYSNTPNLPPDSPAIPLQAPQPPAQPPSPTTNDIIIDSLQQNQVILD